MTKGEDLQMSLTREKLPKGDFLCAGGPRGNHEARAGNCIWIFPLSHIQNRLWKKKGNSVMKGKRKRERKTRSARFGGMLLRRIANPVAQVQSGLKGLRANETRYS